MPDHIGSMCLRERGAAVVALCDGFHLFDVTTGATTRIAAPRRAILCTRLNDGKADRRRVLRRGLGWTRWRKAAMAASTASTRT